MCSTLETTRPNFENPIFIKYYCRGPPTIYRHHDGLRIRKGISKGVVYKLSERKRTAKCIPPPGLHWWCSSWLLWGWCADPIVGFDHENHRNHEMKYLKQSIDQQPALLALRACVTDIVPRFRCIFGCVRTCASRAPFRRGFSAKVCWLMFAGKRGSVIARELKKCDVGLYRWTKNSSITKHPAFDFRRSDHVKQFAIVRAPESCNNFCVFSYFLRSRDILISENSMAVSGMCAGVSEENSRQIARKLLEKCPASRNALNSINSVQTRCIVKGEAQKSPLFWRFSGVFAFLRISRNSTRKPLNLIKSPIFTNAPCKTACLYNAPSTPWHETNT